MLKITLVLFVEKTRNFVQGATTMKILLIIPFGVFEGKYNNEVILRQGGEAELPVGIAYLKAYLNTYLPEVEVLLFDTNIDAIDYIYHYDHNASMECLWSRVEKRIRDYNPDIVGISAFAHAVAPEAHKLAAICKSISSDIVVVMGGSYPTLSYDVVLKDMNVDVVVWSEGEVVLCNLVKALLNKEGLAGIKGIIYRESGKIKKNAQQHQIENLDDLPFPDFSDLPVALYDVVSRNALQRTMVNLKTISINTARGCLYNCGFCATKRVWGAIRYRSPQSIMEEIRQLKGKYNFNLVKFNDDLLTGDHKRVIDISNSFIRTRVVDHWSSAGVTVTSLTDSKMVDKMVESGYHYFALPIESGCNSTLKQIGKPHKLESVGKAIENLRKHKEVYMAAVFLVGFPFETKEDIVKTYDFAASLDIDWACFNIFIPFPETRLYDLCVEKGYLKGVKFGYNNFNTAYLTTPHFTREWLDKTNYYHNLKVNFVNNYNTRKGKYLQAIREFELVINVAPEHAFAWLFLGYAQELHGDWDAAKSSYDNARKIIETEKFWGNYFMDFKKDIEDKIHVTEWECACDSKSGFNAPFKGAWGAGGGHDEEILPNKGAWGEGDTQTDVAIP